MDGWVLLGGHLQRGGVELPAGNYPYRGWLDDGDEGLVRARHPLTRAPST